MSAIAVATPNRSLEQRLTALQEANRIRSSRAELKREIKYGRRLMLDVLSEPSADIETMKLIDLMLAAPKYGRVKVNKILARNRISPSKTVGGLTTRQRNELVALLEGRQ